MREIVPEERAHSLCKKRGSVQEKWEHRQMPSLLSVKDGAKNLHSETSLLASNLLPSDSEASGVMERQHGEKATQVAKKDCRR